MQLDGSYDIMDIHFAAAECVKMDRAGGIEDVFPLGRGPEKSEWQARCSRIMPL